MEIKHIERNWTEKELQNQKMRIYRTCYICKRKFPPLRIFRWNSKTTKKNKIVDGKDVCDNCYMELKEKKAVKNNFGKIVLRKNNGF